ncbi:hypothetical protein V2W30_13600 [Streptomyces sp. Q6]|uniref:Uncharacterized protein n=1 Tax=Streptomyces citrinus TaxID=3118173 RepID=A0ACD5AAP6_9ACTN
MAAAPAALGAAGRRRPGPRGHRGRPRAARPACPAPPLDEVGRTADALPDSTPGSLAEGWREGDPATLDALAEAELVRLGLRAA